MPGDLPAIVQLRLDGELTIYRAEELKQSLIGPLAHAVQLEVDLSGVTEIDTAGLQLLMLARRTASEFNGALRLRGHSPAVRDVFELLRLADHLGEALLPAAPSHQDL